MDKKKICDIAVDITKSGVITGVKTLAEKSFVCSWIKNWYEEFGHVSGERRTTLVENEFTSRFLKLENELGKEKILNTPNLASLFTTTYQSAMTDVSEDKVSFYANTLINAIKNESFEDSKTHVFLNLLKELTVKHLTLLHYLQNPVKNAELPENTGNYSSLSLSSDLKRRCPWLSDDDELLRKIMKDLYNNGLTKLEGITFGRVEYNCSQYAQKYTTKLGDEFLAFITEQEAKNA